MKKTLFYLFFLFLPYASFSQQVFIKVKPQNLKSDVAFGEPSPSVAFFGIDDETDTFKKHKANIKNVNAYFGPVYDSFPIFDIGSGKLIEYQNKSGKYFFYRVNTKKPFGMVISNGKDQPIMVNTPDAYLKTIKTYLNIANPDYLIPKTLDANNQKSAQVEMEAIMKSTFVPDQKYAESLLKNANTVHYTKPSKAEQELNCNCLKKVYHMYKDSLMKEETAQSMEYIYNDKKQYLATINYTDGKPSGTIKYIRNPNGLINKMVMDYGNSSSEVRFIYEKDKFHTISMDGAKPDNYETFFLNDQMQCVRRLSKRNDGSLIWDISYVYDKFGRLVREAQTDSETIYTYKSDQDDVFSQFEVYTLNPRKLSISNQIIREKNKQTFLGRDGNLKPTMKHITINTDNCTFKTYAYDANNNLNYFIVIKCK
ncbi:hypothetical protein [Pedobacter punctiformis]|uniref:RHS repeat protein n=1 Tax=Pedobacter punctiformis TaxID=3004097 RepID=A0ABT4L7R2_9SPHI|nr:hypothetical protein [Pedobacter sp. HCMS5-2]MCZ4243950.1 hypothetical protein [Pedobacter sp. HCMS5-2]